jgi:hypothetical protein
MMKLRKGVLERTLSSEMLNETPARYQITVSMNLRLRDRPTRCQEIEIAAFVGLSDVV